jgi:hypothetical protein
MAQAIEIFINFLQLFINQLKGIIMQLITGKVSEISRDKIIIGEMEISLDKFALKKVSVGDKITALVKENPKYPEDPEDTEDPETPQCLEYYPPTCLALRNLTRNVSAPSHTDAIIYWCISVISISFSIIAFLFAPSIWIGLVPIPIGIVGLLNGLKSSMLINILKKEIDHQESQDQEKV